MKENGFVKFKFHYNLSRKIPFTTILDNVPNVQLVTQEDSLIGFDLILEKQMDLERAESESNEFAYLLSDLISIKSQKYTTPNLSGYEATDVYGVTRVHSNLVLKWNVEGTPAKLDTLDQITNILNSEIRQINLYISSLARAVILEYEHFPELSIIEAFKIIEKNESFHLYGTPFYYKYYALRNIIAHSPEYHSSTIRYFRDYLGETVFDYITYDPDHSTIILNFHSPKTQKALSMLLRDMMTEVRKYLEV